MREENRSALKEWAAIEQALASGHISLLLRKGGLWERREGFEVEHREFWIFPTRYHQNPDELRPDFHWLIESARAAQPGLDRVRIGLYATVEEAFRVESMEAVERLGDLHPFTAATVESRFAYRNEPGLHVLLLRTYRLPGPHVVPDTLDYEGCMSWVELDEALATHGAVPTLPDRDFAARRAEVAERLARNDVVRL